MSKKISRAYNLAIEDPNLSNNLFDSQRQGINIRNIDDLLDHTSYKIRSNSNFKLSINNRKKLDENVFDDTIIDNIPDNNKKSSSKVINIDIGGHGKFAHYLCHEAEKRDLGQLEFYETNGNFFVDEINIEDPLKIINSESFLFSSERNFLHISLDGSLEPFNIKSYLQGSTTEFPYLSKGIRANVGQIEDPYRRNSIIQDGYNLYKNKDSVYNSSTMHYLDAQEYFGLVDIPPVFPIDNRKIEPFVEAVNSNEEFYKDLRDDEMKNLLSYRSQMIAEIGFDKHPRTGWIGFNNDSIAFRI
jgi:hypothetical protein